MSHRGAACAGSADRCAGSHAPAGRLARFDRLALLAAVAGRPGVEEGGARAGEELQGDGIPARVVSMPSWELFEQQDKAYRDRVLPPDVRARLSVEQGSVLGWDHYVGMTGAKIGMHTFGSSAPLKDLQTKFGFTPNKVLATAKDQLAMAKGQGA